MSKHDKSSVFLRASFYIWKPDTQIRNIQPKHCYCIIGIRYLPGNFNFRGIWKTHSLMESMVLGIYESKFVVLKHFGCDVWPKESSAPFLFTIYILKSEFCKDNSVEYAFDPCVGF